MSQPTSIDLSHQVPRSGGTYDATSPQYGSNTVYVSADKTLKVFEQNVCVLTGSPAIVLPPVVEAVGRLFVITAVTAATAPTVDDAGDDYEFAQATMAGGEAWLFVSNGVHWVVLKGGDTT